MSSRLFKHQMASTTRGERGSQFAIGFDKSPWTAAYNYKSSTGSFTHIPASAISTAAVTAMAYSKDGKWVAYTMLGGDAPFAVYRRTAEGFTRVNIPIASISGVTRISFSDDNNYLIMSGSSSPFLFIYKVNAAGDNFIRITTGMPSISDRVFNSRLSPDGTYLAVGILYVPIAFYKRNGDTFNTALALPTNYYNSDYYGFAWSSDSVYCFSASYNTTNPLIVYKRTGDTFAKVADTNGAAVSAARHIALSPDETHVAIATLGSPFYSVFKWNGVTLTKLAGLPTIPDAGASLVYSPDGKYLIIGHSNLAAGQPAFTVLQRNGDVYTKVSSFGTNPTVITVANAVAFGPPAAV